MHLGDFMRICEVASYPPPYGGVSITMKQSSELWSKKGHSVIFLDTYKPFDLHLKISDKIQVFGIDIPQSKVAIMKNIFTNIKRSNLKSYKLLKKNEFSMKEIFAILILKNRILELIKKEKSEIIHTHHLINLASAAACIASMESGLPLVVTAYGEAWKFNKDKKKLRKMSFVANYANHIISPSEHCKNGVITFLGIPREKVTKVLAGIEFDFYSQKVDASDLRDKLNLGDSKVILFFGHLDRRKGPDIAIEAFAEVKKKFNNVKLVIIGGDYFGYRSYLEELINKLNLENDAILIGEVPHEDTQKYYSITDIFVFPTRDIIECMGMTLMQAMAAEIPCVAANIDGVPEAVVHNKSGLLFTPEDVNDLTEKILLLLENEELGKSLAREAKITAEKNFRKEFQAERIFSVFEKVLGGS